MFALKNLLRRRIRTILTVLGVALGVATVVALISVSQGFRSQFNTFFAAGDSHLVVTKKGVSDPFLSYLPEEIAEEIAATEGVVAAHPFFWGLQQVEGNPLFFLFGVTPGSPFFSETRVVAGEELYAADCDGLAICLGDMVAEHLELGVGDTLVMADEEFEVVGIFEAQVPLYTGGGLLRIEDAQRLAGLEGKLSTVLVEIEDIAPEAITAAATRIEEAFPDVKVSEPTKLVDTFDEFELNEQGVRVFTILAIVVGGIGVMNTMLMSVFERTREIGVLQAIGWSKAMILRQILLEGVLVCVLGGFLGIGIGVAGVEAIAMVGQLGWVAGDYGPRVFAEAFAVAIAMGTVGAAYPAFRAVRITPIAALRYE